MAVDIVPGTNALEYTHLGTGFNLPLANAAPPFTMFARVKLNATPGSLGATIFELGRIPPGFAAFGAVRLGVNHEHQFFASFGFFTSLFPATLALGTWYNVAGVYSTTSFRQAWLNGVSAPANTSFATTTNETVRIGASTGPAPGDYNRPLKACVQDVVLWRRALNEAELLELNTTEDPSTLHRTDIIFHVPLADEATATVAWDYTSGVAVAVPLYEIGTGGSITTCNDSPDTPDPAEDECAGEDVADADPTPETWPTCDLVPEDIDVQAVSETQTPGRSLGGRQQFVQRAAGHWRIELIGIPVWTSELTLQWQALESTLDGRNGTILVPFYEAPLSTTPIAATAAGDFAIGDVAISIDQTAGATLRAGMHFSAGDRGYRIKRVREADGDGNYTVVIWPPLRDAIELDDTLDFNTPHVRCRLERDDGMAIMFELLKFGKHTVAFVEDV